MLARSRRSASLGRLLLALSLALSLIVLVIVLLIIVLVVVVGALDRGNKLAGIFLVVVVVLGPLVTVDCGTGKDDVNRLAARVCPARSETCSLA